MLLLLTAAAGPLVPTRARAEFGSPSDAQVSWTYGDGRPVRLPWRAHGAWRFTEDTGTPVLRTWIELPSDVIPEKITGNAVSHRLGDEESPFASDHVIRIDVTEAGATLKLSVRTRKARTYELVASVAPRSGSARVWADPSCRDREINLTVNPALPAGSFLFAGARCEKIDGNVQVHLFTSADAKAVELPPSARETGQGARAFMVGEARQQRILARARILDARRGVTELLVGHSPPVDTSPRFGFSAGAQVSYVSYSQSPGGVEISQIGLTLKSGASYRLVRNWIELSGSGYVTALPLGLSTGTWPAARFYGVNGRVGLRLPGTREGTDWLLHGGWYYMGMIVSGSVYGVKSLTGPQITMDLRHRSQRGRSWFGYLKAAPIAATPGSFSFASRELAAGAGLSMGRLGSSMGGQPWFLTVDASQTAFQSGSHSLGILSVSLGVSTSI